MRPVGIVIGTPSVEHGARMLQRPEQGLIELLVAQVADEGLCEGILHQLAGRDVVLGDVVIVCPSQDGVRSQ